ncbi:MAG: ATP-binding protein [Bifidobacteriaceae bacterium]|jgi:HTH-type transcriptional repressor of NAD biosynthesis genes|nr:ATP-binding protein [Bifidobacteriaceae bacterium]
MEANPYNKNLIEKNKNLEETIKKVLIIGTESTGKTTLCENMAKEFKTQFVHELGRDVTEEVGDTMKLTNENYCEIFVRHFMEIRKKEKIANRILFVDTDSIDTLFWHEVTFDETPQYIYDLEKIVRVSFDAIIYLHPTGKWVDDGTRQFEKEREVHNQKLLKMVRDAYRRVPLYELKGDFKQNTNDAVEIIKEYLV